MGPPRYRPAVAGRYRRALADLLGTMCDEFREAGFLIDRLVEPRPVKGMAAVFPEEFEKLFRQLGFIIFRLLKPGHRGT